jgi:Holliday junction resolvasome RuvABC endonuclease subunit
MKTIIGIDPGTKQSGWVIVTDGKIEQSGVMENNLVLQSLENIAGLDGDYTIAIEWIQAMGMAVGKEVFETCMWVGRFAQACGQPVRLIPRGKIKLHHCGSARAKDANICQSLRDKYGEKGTAKNPGFFFGVSSHAWQAFAVAAYVLEGARHDDEIWIG